LEFGTLPAVSKREGGPKGEPAMQKKPLVSTLKTPKKPKKPNVAAAPAKKLSDFSFTMALIEERQASAAR